MPATSIYVAIAVFKGDPVDFQKYRHTALHFDFGDGQAPVTIHAIGTPGDYEVEMRESYAPSASLSFAKDVEVGWLAVEMTKPQLIAFVHRTRPDNGSDEYNCHSWVQEVLMGFRDAGYISAQIYSDAVDGMLGATLEATDESW